MKIINFAFLLILGALAIGAMVFKTLAPTNCATIINGDSIFVLTGDDARIPFARRHMRDANNTVLYIIGAGGPVESKQKNIVIESDSKSTYQNAIAIKNIVKRDGLDRIVLITSVDHFNRARYLISGEIPNVEIATCPVPLHGMTVTKRLQRWGLEYAKYIGTLFGYRES